MGLAGRPSDILISDQGNMNSQNVITYSYSARTLYKEIKLNVKQNKIHIIGKTGKEYIPNKMFDGGFSEFQISH